MRVVPETVMGTMGGIWHRAENHLGVWREVGDGGQGYAIMLFGVGWEWETVTDFRYDDGCVSNGKVFMERSESEAAWRRKENWLWMEGV